MKYLFRDWICEFFGGKLYGVNCPSLDCIGDVNAADYSKWVSLCSTIKLNCWMVDRDSASRHYFNPIFDQKDSLHELCTKMHSRPWHSTSLNKTEIADLWSNYSHHNLSGENVRESTRTRAFGINRIGIGFIQWFRFSLNELKNE